MPSLPLDVAAEVHVLRHRLGIAEGHGETSLSSQEREMEGITWAQRAASPPVLCAGDKADEASGCAMSRSVWASVGVHCSGGRSSTGHQAELAWEDVKH